MIVPRPQNDPRGGQAFLVPAILLGTLGLALFVALAGAGQDSATGGQSPSLLLAGGAVGLVGLALTLVRSEAGIVLLPIVAVAVPFAVGTGTASMLVASLLFTFYLGGLWVARMLLRQRLVLVRSPLTAPVLSFVMAATLGTMSANAGQHPLVFFPSSWTQIQVGGLSVIYASATALLVVLNNLRDLCWLRRLTWVFLGVAAVAIAGFFAQARRDLPGFSIGGLFSLWVVALALGQALFNARLAGWQRAALVLLAAAWAYRRFTFENDWLSGWLPIGLVIVALAFLRSWKLFLMVLAGMAILALVSYESFLATQVMGDESQGNFLRFDLWAQSLQVMEGHHWLGLGIAGYAPYYGSFFPDRALSTHSNYLDILAQTGFVGSAIFVWLLATALAVAVAARRRWRSGFAAGFANGMLAGLAATVLAMALGDWVIPFVYNQTIAGYRYTVHTWLLLGALGAMQHMQDDAPSSPTRAALPADETWRTS